MLSLFCWLLVRRATLNFLQIFFGGEKARFWGEVLRRTLIIAGCSRDWQIRAGANYAGGDEHFG
jgi:hypothetical protein